jgi:hypothetical protein
MPDPFLDALERRAVICCGVFALAAFLLTRGWRAPAGVLGGGVLIAVSFLAIRSSIEQMTPVRGGPPRVAKPLAAAVKLVGRYALLAILAYVMIARLRMHPVALLTGASSVVAAAAVDAARLRRSRND